MGAISDEFVAVLREAHEAATLRRASLSQLKYVIEPIDPLTHPDGYSEDAAMEFQRRWRELMEPGGERK
jgi:hypothetical protein